MKIMADNENATKCQQKREQNILDMIADMESRKEQAKEVLDAYITALADSEKIDSAKLSEVATAMGIVIDKFVNNPLKHQLDQQKGVRVEINKGKFKGKRK